MRGQGTFLPRGQVSLNGQRNEAIFLKTDESLRNEWIYATHDDDGHARLCIGRCGLGHLIAFFSVRAQVLWARSPGHVPRASHPQRGLAHTNVPSDTEPESVV